MGNLLQAQVAKAKRRSDTNKLFSPEYDNPDVSLSDFDIMGKIGEGAFGEVKMVEHKPSGTIYAMKILQKRFILERHASDKQALVENTKQEEAIQMRAGEHPFIVNLRFAFQDDQCLYIILDYCSGGDMFTHLTEKGLLTEDIVRVHVAEIVLALELSVVYRDLKLENILLDENNHVRLTDFGLAKEVINYRPFASTFCGTKEYMAPEIVEKSNKYTPAVDWWSLGVAMYAMLIGRLPFFSETENHKELYDMILHAEPEYPESLSEDCVSLIQLLLRKKYWERPSAAMVKEHPFFKSINWDKLFQLSKHRMALPGDNDYCADEPIAMSPSSALARVPKDYSFAGFSTGNTPPESQTPNGDQFAGSDQALAAAMDDVAQRLASFQGNGVCNGTYNGDGCDDAAVSGSVDAVATPPAAVSRPRPSQGAAAAAASSTLLAASVLESALPSEAASSPVGVSPPAASQPPPATLPIDPAAASVTVTHTTA